MASDPPGFAAQRNPAKPQLIRVSKQREAAAELMYNKLTALANAGFTHFVHWTTGHARGQRIRMITYNEFCSKAKRSGQHRRGDVPLQPEEFADLVGAVPEKWLAMLNAAHELQRRERRTPLRDLLWQCERAPETWVQYELDGELLVGQVDQQQQITNPHFVDPRRVLQPWMGILPTTATAPTVQTAVVWSEERLAHSLVEDEARGRAQARGEEPDTMVLLYGGPAVNMVLLKAALSADSGAHPIPARGLSSCAPTQFCRWYAPTDRKREPIALSSLDVHHLYAMQLSHVWQPVRTVDLHHIPTTTTSSSFVGILQHDSINISAMRRLLFTSLCEYASRRTRDVMYRLLTDASPYGVRCCKRSCTKGKCDLCWYLQDTHVAESTHHVHHECIYSQLVTVGMYRGFIEATAGSDDERAHTRRSTTAQLASQHRRALETGLLLADGPAERQGSTVWHELIAATHFVLEKRRNRNAYFATPLAYDATDAYRDARALAQTVATGLRILALAETEWIQIHYNNWLPEDGKSPIDKWTAAWIETGAAEVTQGGSVRLLLPATLGDIPGAETQTPDIRDQPGGDALFQFWMENRRKEDERLGRDRGRAGGGDRDGVGDGAPRARSQLQLSSLATS